MTRVPGRLLVLAVAAASAPRVFADGGAVQFRQETGPFLVTLFAAPAPLRAGPVDLSVMVQDRTSLEPVLDADVSLRLSAEGGPGSSARLTRANAQNKLLYAAPIDISKAGTGTRRSPSNVRAPNARCTDSCRLLRLMGLSLVAGGS